MANNIFQQAVTPVKPKSLAQERVFVYVEEATVNTKGIASFGQDDFIVNNGHVVLNTASLSRTPFDKFSLIKLDRNDFVLTEDLVTQVNWPYAHLNGHENTNGAGLIKIAPDSIGYLRFTTDENYYLEVDIDKVSESLQLNNRFTELSDRIAEVQSEVDDLGLEIGRINLEIDDLNLDITTLNSNLSTKLDKIVTVGNETATFSNSGHGAQINARGNDGTSTISLSQDHNSGIILNHSPLLVSATEGIDNLVRIDGSNIYQRTYDRATGESATVTISPAELEIMVEDDTNSSIVLVTPSAFTYNGEDVATKRDIENLNAIMIRNMEPDLVINATIDTVQTVATGYINSHYNRAPMTNDGLYITLTDKNNDVVKYAYYNNSWVNIGLNDVDLSNYVDLTSPQNIGGNKNFTGDYISYKGARILNANDYSELNNKIETNISKRLLIGADGIIEDSNIIFTVQNSESFDEYLTNQRVFSTSLFLPVVGTLDETLTIRIEFGDTVYNVYSFMTGGDTPLTIGELKSVMSYNINTGYSFYPNLLFVRNSEYTGFVIDPATVTATQLASLDIGGRVSVDNISITENTDGEIQAVALKNGLKVINDNSVSNENFSGVTHLTQAQFEQLTRNGSIVVNGQTIVYDPNHIYITTDNVLQDLTLTQSNMMLISEEEIIGHVHVMLEFETDGVHYGTDFILHPYDTSICLVSFRFSTYDSNAYLDDSGKINIMIPSGLTFTNVKAHYISLGG